MSLIRSTRVPFRTAVAAVALFVVTLLGATQTADARGTGLQLDRADRAAEREAQETLHAWGEAYEPGENTDGLDPGADVYIVGYSLDPCERQAARLATCDVTYMLDDGSECDDTLTISTTRRNRLRVMSTGPWCDGD